MSNEEDRHVSLMSSRPDGELLVEEIRQHLIGWANVLRSERTGNPTLSKELRFLAKILKPHGALTIKALSVLMANVSHSPPTAKAGGARPRKELPKDMKALGCDQVNLILDDEGYLKKQIVDLGATRFGIPRGKLNSLPRQSAIASIRAAMDHERSLAALGRQAQIAGSRRA